ncbi:hypothetical protein T492DRAFT_935202 [Pavlovales sp. CCMP2436]|nr:hypothetical protein T492DRAFT_935202 [Pavlovales sp. CCMP2436]
MCALCYAVTHPKAPMKARFADQGTRAARLAQGAHGRRALAPEHATRPGSLERVRQEATDFCIDVLSNVVILSSATKRSTRGSYQSAGNSVPGAYQTRSAGDRSSSSASTPIDSWISRVQCIHRALRSSAECLRSRARRPGSSGWASWRRAYATISAWYPTHTS